MGSHDKDKRRKKRTLAPGVEVRTDGRGANLSFGVPGQRVTLGSGGRVTRTSGYRSAWDQVFDPFSMPSTTPIPGGIAGGIDQPGPPPEPGWLDALPKAAPEPANPFFDAAMEELDAIDPTQAEDYLPDRGPIRRKAEAIVDMVDPTDAKDREGE